MGTSSAVSSPVANNMEEINTSELSQDLDDILSSFSPPKSTDALKSKGPSAVSRFRVKWRADVVIDGQSTHHGFVNDISTLGASIYADSSLPLVKSTLHILVPPLSSTSPPHIIEVSGRTAYVVFDGDKQLYRAAVNFLQFRLESDLAFLDERLTKHQLKIPEGTLIRC